MTILFCEDAPTLKLGPGPKLPESEVITFVNGYAEIDADDPNYDEKMRWVHSSQGVYKLEVLQESERGRVASAVQTEFVCSFCDKRYDTKNALNGHRMSHFPKKAN